MRQVTLTLLVCLVAAFACGCAEKNTAFGESVRMTMDSQKINPEPAPAEPVEGLDGQKAAGIIDSYSTTNQTTPHTPQRTYRPARNVNLFMKGK